MNEKIIDFWENFMDTIHLDRYLYDMNKEEYFTIEVDNELYFLWEFFAKDNKMYTYERLKEGYSDFNYNKKITDPLGILKENDIKGTRFRKNKIKREFKGISDPVFVSVEEFNNLIMTSFYEDDDKSNNFLLYFSDFTKEHILPMISKHGLWLGKKKTEEFINTPNINTSDLLNILRS